MNHRKKNKKALYIILIVLFLAALGVFWYLATTTIYERAGGFDLRMIEYCIRFAGPGLVQFMKAITFFGSTWFLFTGYITLIGYFLAKKNYRYALAIFIVSFGAWNLSKLFKALFRRGRPEYSFIAKPTDYSFPSGHALTSFVFCAIVAWLVWQTSWKALWKWVITIFLLLFTLSIGASRVVLNVHYASDVIGGFALAIMWLVLAMMVWVRVKGQN